MGDEFTLLKSGMTVDIKRTDGRMHAALISGLNRETRSVTVEWFESGETKGKEIDLDCVLQLNPLLINNVSGNSDANIIPVNHRLSRTEIEGHTEEDSQNDVMFESDCTSSSSMKGSVKNVSKNQNHSKKIARKKEDNKIKSKNNKQAGDTKNDNEKRSSSKLIPLQRNPTKSSMPVIANKGSYRSSKLPSRPTTIIPVNNNNHHAETVSSYSTDTVPATPCTPVATIPPRVTQTFQQPNLMPPPTTAATTNLLSMQAAKQQELAANKQGRRSNVVKEVEKLKKNREERRQRQAELKEEKEALMNSDPGNPNWEFVRMIRQFQEGIEYHPLRENDPIADNQITVCVRKRPLNKKELTRKEVDVITVPRKDQIVVHEPKNKVDLTKYLENQRFRFDYAFDENCTNELVYRYSAKPLVQTIFDGGMATCFAYGQTGSGKTHTMGGDFNGKTQDCKKGIYAMAAKDVFKYLKSNKYRSLNLIVSASFFEIYSGKVFDLLADKAKLRVLEDGKQQVQVVGLTENVVDSVEEVLKIIQKGNNARTSGQTSANSNSSRSHAVFQIVLRNPTVNKIHGKFSLIDLAGNERGADTHSADRQTRMEGAEINKSLLALKECIRALGRKGAHLPFRASKLTQVLRDSFIGDKSKTCMIAMISPSMSSCEHSLNTLRYADRVKELAATDDNKNSSPPVPSNDYLSRNNNDIHVNGNGENLDDSELAALRSLNTTLKSNLKSIRNSQNLFLHLIDNPYLTWRRGFSESFEMEGELSAEMYTFHEALSHLQDVEEEVLEEHKNMLEMEANAHKFSLDLFGRTRVVDYDQEAYSQDLQQLVSEKLSAWNKFGEKVNKFREQLLAEEKLSQMMKNTPYYRYNQ